jgi:hypothetical protein
LLLFYLLQREYEEFKIRINRLVAKATKVPEEGWVMQDGTPWPGNNVRDHPGMIQVGRVIAMKMESYNLSIICHL